MAGFEKEKAALDALGIEVVAASVDAEDKAKPFSDDELVNRLKTEGFPVARRTVTKYRKKMGIPSSRQRRDWSAKK